MSKSLIIDALKKNPDLFRGQSVENWAQAQQEQGEKIALYRRYAQGDHRANLTAEMRKLLRISDTGGLNDFNDNYMDIIIQTPVDRLEVTAIEADNDGANEPIAKLLSDNRVDGLQTDLHQAAFRDGHTFGHAYWDNDAQRVVLVHEPAYDGVSGVIAIHNTPGSTQPDIALKVWKGTVESVGDTTYITVYYPDRMEKYESHDGGALQRRQVKGEVWPAPWTLPTGEPIGVPFVHFRNRGDNSSEYGLSEIASAIPIQDALNRTLYSMVMAAELTAFGVRWAKGFTPPASLTPGMWITIAGTGLDKEKVAELGMMEQGEIMPFIQQAQWLTSEMGKITRTPAPEFMGSDTASGEALKQREIGLLGKVKRFQVKAGNAWEDWVQLAHRIQTAWGNEKPPVYERLYARWADIELRNDKETVENVLAVADRIGERETLRQLAPVFGWDESKIDELINEKRQDKQSNLLALPMFQNAGFGLPTATNPAGPTAQAPRPASMPLGAGNGQRQPEIVQ
jgi:hypothetical protein